MVHLALLVSMVPFVLVHFGLVVEMVHFVELGHKHIAHIGGPKDYNFARQRKNGWLRGLKSSGLKVPLNYEEITELTFDGGKEAMQRAEECHGIAPEQYGSRKKKAADIQALNTRLFYD